MVLGINNSSGVLIHASPRELNDVFTLLDSFGYFSNEENRQVYIEKLLNFRGPLQFATGDVDRLQAIIEQLNALGCFNNSHSSENKQKIVEVLLSQAPGDANNALLWATSRSMEMVYSLLDKAECFNSPSGRQKFSDALFALNHHGNSFWFFKGKINEDTTNSLLPLLEAKDSNYAKQIEIRAQNSRVSGNSPVNTASNFFRALCEENPVEETNVLDSQNNRQCLY